VNHYDIYHPLFHKKLQLALRSRDSPGH